MANLTPNLGLFKYDPLTDTNQVFSFEQALNDNWDILDKFSKELPSGRNIGEIIASAIPLTDAGLHLLDGTRLSGDGIYGEFVDYIAGLYTENPTANYFAQPLLEQDWIQPILSSNGVLGGDSFACAADSNYNDFYAYKALDGNTSTSWQSNGTTTSGTWFKFYNPTPIKVTQITWSGTPTYGTITGGIIYGSNDDLVYTQLGTFSNGTTTGGTIDLSTNTNFYKYYKITPTTWTDTSGTFTNGWAELTITAKTQSKTAEQVWQDSISKYGVCGKFVYDSVNNTVRLPKITGKLDGTTDLTALGDLVSQYVKLPNITGGFGHALMTETFNSSGVFYDTAGDTWSRGTSSPSTWKWKDVAFDASRSSSVYSGSGSDTKIHEQAINVLYYIVVATTSKTSIQVDIDDIATDLNGKCDTDGTNATFPHITETYVNGASWYRIYSDGWCEQGANKAANTSTINFLKAFINTDYFFVEKTYRTSATGDSYNYYSSKSTNSITILQQSENGYWFACGYIR